MSALCYTRVESEFNDRYRKLLMTLKGKDESDMLHYLENNWSGRVTQWAGFARIWSPFNTSMMVERFHKRLKYENQGRVGNSRLDSIVHSLINIPAVLAHDFEIRMRRRLSYGRHRFAEQLNAHKAGMKALHNAQLQVLVTDKGWEVRSGRTYFIEQKQCECDPALNNHCTRDGCGACAYAYCCTCNGDGKAGVCCLHIHAAIVAHPEGRQFRFPSEDGNDNIHSACDVDVNNNVDVDNFVVEPEVDIVGNNKENVEETDRMDRNKDNIQKIEMLCSQIKSISLEIAKKPDACDVLDDVVVNMQQIYQQLAARTEQRAPLNRRFELNTVGPIKKDVPIRLLSRKAAKKAIMIYRHRIESGHHCAPYL
ncbi:hypothetical protein Q1695_005959 [Nippostrongylus brasiliensis]|nr:hypothetical protein Q1695_005959 [Nippostrongylus brasiliensis]